MKIVGIVSVDPNFAIGAGGKLINHSPVDMAFFCGFTQGKMLLVGRTTAESIKSILPGRDVICVSSSMERAFDASHCVKHHWDGKDRSVLEKSFNCKELVVIGGTQVYNMFDGEYDEFYVTHNSMEYDGASGDADAFFDNGIIDTAKLPHREVVFSSKMYNLKIVKYWR